MDTTQLDTSTEATIERLQRRIEKLKQRQRVARENVARFRKLDFEGWNKKDWKLFGDLHTGNVRVVEGSMVTNGRDAHVQTMQAMLASTDSQIRSHDIVFGSGEWTCCVATAVDRSASGEERDSSICTVARWRDGRIAEEYLFVAARPEG
jgi:SnoaL-like domain